MKRYRRALHIFRRDLRVTDNTALNAALDASDEVVGCFFFNDSQVRDHPYRSVNGLAFMIESLEELAHDIAGHGGRLIVVHGNTPTLLRSLISRLEVDAVFFNRDYTPFSRERDAAIAAACAERSIPCLTFSDALLVEPSEFGKDNGTPYTVYTPFFKKASKISVARPRDTTRGTFAKPAPQAEEVAPRTFWPEHSAPQRRSTGGRSRALAILETINQYRKYDDERNLPALNGTTILAPHNKFGTISIREAYHTVADAFGAEHTLIRELYWRDFFTHIAWHFPHVFRGAFTKMYDAVPWKSDPELFSRWCQGLTGFPIVDAGMRELVTTGFMHNRVRMIVASFLVKDLHISWREGERFFAHHLTDYDPAVNNGSWQWAASTGCDAQPYFRIFNPWLQQKRFDPDCIYVKRWVPELAKLSPSQIHSLYEADWTRAAAYPQPVVDHATQKIFAEEMFRGCQESKTYASS